MHIRKFFSYFNPFSYSRCHSLTVNYAKADVYLFGEILMELVTGKPSNEDGVNIAEWVCILRNFSINLVY